MLNRVNPAPMSAYLDCGNFRLISSSPERFLLRRGQYVESKPIKGTRPRGKDTIEDLRLRQELIESEKDSAELAMIVDLVRNDLGRTAQPGTVRVAAPRIIEEYANVFHSLAIVTSRLREGVSSLELIRSCFPGGSITGCPKVQAMKVIEEIEKNKRSFYCGSIGCVGFNGDFDLSIAIRTFIEKNGNLYFNLGGGIVYDSDPQEEYDETIHKGETMFQAITNGVKSCIIT
jgi:para-aminobenzoate synthetase component 1